MPSISKKQADFMRAVAHNPGFAKKVGVPQSVGKEFNQADKESGMKTKKMAMGGTSGRPTDMPSQSNKGGAMRGLERAAAMSGRTMPVKKMAVGGTTGNAGGAMRGLDRAAAMSGRTMPGRVTTMAKGGLAAGHKSADGIATKGKTKGAMVKMAKGGRSC